MQKDFMKALRNTSAGKELKKYGVILTIGILALLIHGCAGLNVSDAIDTMPVRIESFDGMEYWCLEKTDFTAVIQEAIRCQE